MEDSAAYLSVPPVEEPLPNSGEDMYPDLLVASIDASDPILSGTRTSRSSINGMEQG